MIKFVRMHLSFKVGFLVNGTFLVFAFQEAFQQCLSTWRPFKIWLCHMWSAAQQILCESIKDQEEGEKWLVMNGVPNDKIVHNKMLTTIIPQHQEEEKRTHHRNKQGMIHDLPFCGFSMRQNHENTHHI